MKTSDINRIINIMIETHQRTWGSSQLENLLYIQLLHHYIQDLELENQRLELMNKAYEIADELGKKMQPIQPLPYPPPTYPGPSNPYQPWPISPIVTYTTTDTTTEK